MRTFALFLSLVACAALRPGSAEAEPRHASSLAPRGAPGPITAAVTAAAASEAHAAAPDLRPAPRRPIASANRPSAAPSAACLRWRRILIGAAIGTVAAVPLARLVHARFENEAADGTPAAAWVVGLGGLGGALIGNATCGD